MALRVYEDAEGTFLNSSLLALLQSIPTTQKVTILTSSQFAADILKKELANTGHGFNREVRALSSWARLVWEKLGDGTISVPRGKTCALAWKMLKKTQSTLPLSGGLANLVASLAHASSAELRNLTPQELQSLSAEQKAVVQASIELADSMKAKGMITTSDMYDGLAGAVAFEPSHILVAGFFQMDAQTAWLITRMAAVRAVDIVLPVAQKDLLDQLEVYAKRAGAAVNRMSAAASVSLSFGARAELGFRSQNLQATEIQRLRKALYQKEPPFSLPLDATGAVTLLEASGPRAEAEQMVRSIVHQVEEGAEQLIVLAPHPERLFYTVAQKLAARGIFSWTRWHQSAETLPLVRLTLAFFRLLARLDALARASQEADGQPRLQERSWWPPRALTDFLLLALSGVPQNKALALDAKWRARRNISAHEVLRDVQHVGTKAFQDMVAAARNKDFAQAASFALQLSGAIKDREAHAAFSAVREAAEEIEEVFGEEYASDTLLEAVLSATSLTESYEAGFSRGKRVATVALLTPQEAQFLPPQSADVLIWSQLTAAAYPLSKAETAQELLQTQLGLGNLVDPKDAMPKQAERILTIPTHALYFARATHTSLGQETEPAPLLQEVMNLYGRKPHKNDSACLPLETWGEEWIAQNLTDAGRNVEEAARYMKLHHYSLSSAEIASYLYFAPGQTKPTFSATSLELYRACPYRWFFERALAPRAVDASLNAIAQGDYVHALLQRTYEALKKDGIVLNSADKEDRRMSLVLAQDTAERIADELLDVTKTDDPEIAALQRSIYPQTQEELDVLRAALQDVKDFLAYNASLFEGFIPEEFEYTFGQTDGEETHADQAEDSASVRLHDACSYGGAFIRGKIDRIDVDSEGNALIIDYKNTKRKNVFQEFSLGSAVAKPVDGHADAPFAPEHFQALIYAKAAKEVFGITPVGALYLFTKKPDAKNAAQVSGALEQALVPKLLKPLSAAAQKQIGTEVLQSSFEEILQETEDFVARLIKQLLSGNIAPNPFSEKTCELCSVLDCPKRLK